MMRWTGWIVLAFALGAAPIAAFDIGGWVVGYAAKKAGKKLRRQMDQDLHIARMGLRESGGDTKPPGVVAGAPGFHFYLGTFRFRLRPFVQFKLPGITKLRVRTWVEFYWTRPPPEGWAKSA